MNTLATFFASIIALFSGLLGHSSPLTTIQQPLGEVTQVIEATSSTIGQNSLTSSSTATNTMPSKNDSIASTTTDEISSLTDTSTLSKETAKKALFIDNNNSIKVSEVLVDGIIDSGKFAGYKRVMVTAQSAEWAGMGEDMGTVVFIFATKDFKKYVIDGSLDYYYLEKSQDEPNLTLNVVATGTIPLNHPEVITLGSFILNRSGPYTDTLSKNNKKVPSSVVGLFLYLSHSSIIAEDEFGMRFSYELIPKETYIAHKTQPDYNKPNYRDYYFNASEIKTTKPLYKTYGKAFPGSCGYGAESLKEISDVKEDELQVIGTTTYGTTVYALTNSISTFMKNEYDNKIRSINGVKSVTIESYSEKNPLLFMKDPWDRWVAVGEWDYELEGGCGKPVIYLYPKNDTEVSVKINTPITFSTQIPSYNDGWKVLAHPDGTLTNLQPERTDCGAIDYKKTGSEYAKHACTNNSYPYLYWSGNVGADYPTVNNGWIIKRENIKSFMENKLADIGFTVHERNDFIEYWIPEMLKKDAPFFRVSFITTQEMNRFIPMTVIPRPDSVYRLFMDWEPLAQDPSKQLEMQILPTIKRSGFTLIEWGGIHPK